MLDTSQERVELLKASNSGKKIEELYISLNNPQRIIWNCTAINQELDIEGGKK